MLISASRRTDIPAFYSEWLKNRVEAGFCHVPNPFNSKQVARISLLPTDVDAMVLWTRDPRPMLPLCEILDRRGYKYYFQYTLTGYGPPLEPRAPPVELAIESFRTLAHRRPKGSVVWRYDPILLGNAFTSKQHIDRFTSIARRLEGSTDRVVVSVLTLYRKTRRRLGQLFSIGTDLAADPLTTQELPRLLTELAHVAAGHGMTMETCAQSQDWSGMGIGRSKCIDDRLLHELFGGTWTSKKDPGQREACHCVMSRDIGMADTCGFGCNYCYATRSDAYARRRLAEHDPASPSLYGHFEVNVDSQGGRGHVGPAAEL